MSIPADPKDAKKLWAQEERLKAKQERIDKAKAIDPCYDGPSTAEEEEAQSDWDKLKTIAQLKFPPHLAAQFDITPQKRCVAIAASLGWTQAKIALASGYHKNTIGKYLSDERVQEFIKAFEYHSGARSAKEVIDGEQYASLQVLKDLRDNPTVSASTRKEVAIWFLEMKYGKAKESKEIKGLNLRDLTEQLKSTKVDLTLLEELEEKLPNANKPTN